MLTYIGVDRVLGKPKVYMRHAPFQLTTFTSFLDERGSTIRLHRVAVSYLASGSRLLVYLIWRLGSFAI